MPKVVKHMLIWTAYFWYVMLTDYILEGPYFNLLGGFLIYISHNILIFYTLLYCYRRLEWGTLRQIAGTVLRFGAAVLLFVCCRYLVVNYLMALWVDPGFAIWNSLEWWTLAVLWISRYGVIALAYHYFTSYSRKQHEFNAMAEARRLQEQQQLSLENKLLRAQIDPHFLYNALNALYARALPVSGELGKAILKLAEIMRYAIKPTPTNKTVPLVEEIDHIRNIIDIARFRFNNRLHLDLEIEGDFSGVQIVPLALITLSENVLKHANLSNQATPGRIRLHWQEAGLLTFSTWNTKRSSREFPSNGIGLNNTIQRLKDHYADACVIRIEDGIDHFSLEVIIRQESPVGKPDQNLGQVLRS